MYVLPAAVSSPGGQSWRPWLEVLTSFIAIVVVVGWLFSWCQPTLDAIFLRASGPLPEGLCWGSLAGRESSVALRSLVLAVVCRFLQQGYAYAYCMAGLAEFPRALLLARLSIRGIHRHRARSKIYWLALNIQSALNQNILTCTQYSMFHLFFSLCVWHAQSWPTLCNPMDCSLLQPWGTECFSIHGIS